MLTINLSFPSISVASCQFDSGNLVYCRSSSVQVTLRDESASVGENDLFCESCSMSFNGRGSCNAVDHMCPPPSDSHQIFICHFPPGNPSAVHRIEVGRPALDAHLNHGDSYVSRGNLMIVHVNTMPST